MITLFIIAITFVFLVDLTLDFLNLRYRDQPIPPVLREVYSSEKCILQQRYKSENTRFAIIHKSIMFVVLITFFCVGGFGKLHQWIAGFVANPLVTTLLFFAIIGLVSGLISLPFSIWNTFVIEQKYGFNKTTIKLFFIDLIKSMLVTMIIGGGLLSLITWIFYKTGNIFWILALGVIFVFSLLANALYSRVIVPLFNKQTPLPEGTLLESIKNFGVKVGFPVDKVFVINGSKRSTKANAYFTGFGKNRRVVLYDTLIEKMDEQELVAILAHEIGHYRKGHIWFNMVLGLVQSAIFLFLFNILSNSAGVLEALGFYGADQPVFHLAIIGFALLFGPMEKILSLFTHWLSRRMEYEADSFVAMHGMGNELMMSLKKLTAQNLSNLTPHPAYVFVNYSHPTLLQRISNISGVEYKSTA